MSEIRLRRHIDGRIAISTELAEGPYRWIVWPPHGRLTDEHVTGPDWTELFVAELPKPDYTVDDLQVWDVRTGEIVIDILGNRLQTPHGHAVGQLRSDALKMLAAAITCTRSSPMRRLPQSS